MKTFEKNQRQICIDIQLEDTITPQKHLFFFLNQLSSPTSLRKYEGLSQIDINGIFYKSQTLKKIPRPELLSTFKI